MDHKLDHVLADINCAQTIIGAELHGIDLFQKISAPEKVRSSVYHDIHVKPVSAAFLDELGFRRQIGKVGGEHGGRNLGPRNNLRILTHHSGFSTQNSNTTKGEIPGANSLVGCRAWVCRVLVDGNSCA